ncbi:MAG: tol-pal system protein YbgF [candidate division KSB1 bacterium]|nr:tol-pal system protein YbgF [candidate division KSB1 bacterium]
MYNEEFSNPNTANTQYQQDVASNDGETYSAPSYIVGGGFDFLLSPKWGMNAYVDYRFTDTDDLDGGYMSIYGSNSDGYLNGRLGLTYYMGAAEAPAQEESFSGLEEFQLEPESGQQGEIVWEESGAPRPEAQGTDYSELQSRVQNLNQELQSKEKNINELEAQIASQEERIRSLERELNEVEGQMGTAPVTGGGNYKMVYEDAVQQFYNRNYSSAMSSFRSLLNQYPDHKLASNCQYWIGECQFAQGNYSQAVQSFQAVLNYSSSYKFDDALIMLGRSYMKMGNNDNARNVLQRLLNEYPDSEYAGKARNWLNRL